MKSQLEMPSDKHQGQLQQTKPVSVYMGSYYLKADLKNSEFIL